VSTHCCKLSLGQGTATFESKGRGRREGCGWGRGTGGAGVQADQEDGEPEIPEVKHGEGKPDQSGADDHEDERGPPHRPRERVGALCAGT